MATTYTITEGQLVALQDGRPEEAVDCATVFEILASIQLRNMTVAEFLAETSEGFATEADRADFDCRR